MHVDLVFETHSMTEDNVDNGVATGWHPGRLSSMGREQARQLGLRRANDGLSVIFTSGLGRALETVEIAFPEATSPSSTIGVCVSATTGRSTDPM